jgi:hypothetical protein
MRLNLKILAGILSRLSYIYTNFGIHTSNFVLYRYCITTDVTEMFSRLHKHGIV